MVFLFVHFFFLQAQDCHLCQYNDISKEMPVYRANDRNGMHGIYCSLNLFITHLKFIYRKTQLRTYLSGKKNYIRNSLELEKLNENHFNSQNKFD